MWTTAVCRGTSQGWKAICNNMKALSFSANSIANDTSADQGFSKWVLWWLLICINVQYISPVQTFINQPRWMFSLLRVSRKVNWPGKCLSIEWLKLIVKGLFLLLHPAVVLPALTPPSCCCWSIASSELILACKKIWRIIKGRIIWENIKIMFYMSSLIAVKIKSIISGWLRLKRLISAGFILSALSFSHILHGILSTLYLMFKKKKKVSMGRILFYCQRSKPLQSLPIWAHFELVHCVPECRVAATWLADYQFVLTSNRTIWLKEKREWEVGECNYTKGIHCVMFFSACWVCVGIRPPGNKTSQLNLHSGDTEPISTPDWSL